MILNQCETNAVSFFGLDELPELSQGRVIREDIEAAFSYARNQLSVLID